jgi:hypothetical protein
MNSSPRRGQMVNPAQNPGAMGRAGEVQHAQQSQRSSSHPAMNGNAVTAAASGQLTEFGIPENSAVLAPIALQEDEPVRVLFSSCVRCCASCSCVHTRDHTFSLGLLNLRHAASPQLRLQVLAVAKPSEVRVG